MSRAALATTTDLGIGAHPDDLEIMAAGPIVECRRRPGRWFSGVVCTDGRRSPRGGRFSALDDDELARVRHDEQDRAAAIGDFAALVQLGYRSPIVLDDASALVDDLAGLLAEARPTVVFTHEPRDSHRTHAVVCEAVLVACRRLGPNARPQRLVGCEGWRSLARVPDDERADLEWDADPSLERALLDAHASQVEEGPVDLEAELARRLVRPGRHRHRAIDLSPLLAV